MADKSLVGPIIMAICCWGSALLFYCIGVGADRADKPVNFWSNRKVAAEKISDVYGYNYACAQMWKIYSIPYWLGGILGCLGYISDVYIMISAALLFFACLPGAFWLIWRYKGIEKQYICSNALTNQN